MENKEDRTHKLLASKTRLLEHQKIGKYVNNRLPDSLTT